MSPVALTFTIVAAVVVLFIWDIFPVVIVALGTALALYFTGVLSLSEALSGMGDNTVLFIASLFVVSAGLDATGVTTWAGQLLIARAGKSRARLLILIMIMVAVLAALININGAVPALLPVVVVMALRLGQPTSQLMMPLAFAASAGSLLALTGTPVNVIISEQALKSTGQGFGYFEFAIAGIPCLAGCIAITVLFGKKLLPHRNGASMPADLSKHALTLVEHYRISDGVFQLKVRAGSPLIGTLAVGLKLDDYPGMALIRIQDGGKGGPIEQRGLAEGDRLIVRGDAATAAKLATDMTLAFRSEDAPEGNITDTLFNSDSGLAEVIIPPRSAMIGQKVFPGMVTESGDLIILAVQRQGEVYGTQETILAAGDTLLLQGTWKGLDKNLNDPEVLVVDSPELVRRQAIPMGPGSKQAVAILIVLVVLLATGLVPAVVAGLLAACAMVVFRVLTVDQAYRAINWTTVILIGAMTPLSLAMRNSGAAELMANRLVQIVGDSGPTALLIGLFVLTAILGQLISNTATALIIIPIAVTAAADLHISARPVLMSVCVAAAASFLTPVATPVNLIVMGPGGYRFGEYWKLGLPMLLWFFIVSVFLVPLFWPF
ncbi:MAG: SLC13 family permease [Gemmatales bacterium]